MSWRRVKNSVRNPMKHIMIFNKYHEYIITKLHDDQRHSLIENKYIHTKILDVCLVDRFFSKNRIDRKIFVKEFLNSI
jgi:hypothetical protein